ncbi:MAG: ABC transporter permease [Deltaproteobacteria bacterium]|nr:ABC transporter permease [Deltaproteobacteria bacterium]
MFFARLALLNLTRNVRRTALSLASIVAGVAVLILGKGFIGGIRENVIRAQVDTMSGHVLVRPAAYPTEGLSHPLDGLWQVPEAFGRDPEATGMTARTFFVPTAVHKTDSLRARGVVFDPATDPLVFPRDAWKIDGTVPVTAEDGVLVGRGVARLLRVVPGDRIVLQARTPAGAINALDVNVSGIFSLGSPAIDQLGIFVPRPLGEDLLRLEGRASHVLFRLADREHAAAFASRIAPQLPPGTEIRTWEDETAAMLRVQEIREAALNFLVIALLGMSGLGIVNTVLMAAYERVREIGTLQALGMTRSGVLRLFLLEGAMMGVVGSLVGAVIGASVVAYYGNVGIDLSSLIEKQGANLPISAILYLDFDPGLVVAAIAFGIATAVVASVYPAQVASRMVPADAVRG